MGYLTRACLGCKGSRDITPMNNKADYIYRNPLTSCPTIYYNDLKKLRYTRQTDSHRLRIDKAVLSVIEVVIVTFYLHQFIVAAAFDNAAFFDVKDAIGISDG